MKAQEVWKELMDIADCECLHSRLLRAAHSVEMYGEVGKEEREELEYLRDAYADISKKIGDLLA